MVEKQEEAKHVVEFGQLLRFLNSFFFSRIGEKLEQQKQFLKLQNI